MSDKKYLTLKWQAVILRGGDMATCDINSTRIGLNGDLHHILGRFTTGSESFYLASSPYLTAYLSQAAHRKYHDQDPSEAVKNAMFQRLYQLHAVQLGTIEAAHEAVMEAYNALSNTLRTPIAYVPPQPTVALRKWSF